MSARVLLLVTLALAAGCSFDWDRYQPTGANPTVDAGGIDAPGVDSGGGCGSDDDCASNELGDRVCDTSTGRCVACLAARDTCPTGQYCTAAHACADGCRDDDACRASGMTLDGGVDGGAVLAARCNPATRACVQCLADEHCPIGQRCAGAVCVPGCDATRGCPGGMACCDGACVDPNSNAQHCGGCGMACSTVNGAPACRVGVCAVGVCTAPFGDCDGDATNGCETNTRSAAAHCGGCGMACAARPNANVSCVDGACAFECRAGYGDCDSDPSNGCEVDLSRTLSHCGRCDNACAFSGGSGVCAGGACTRTACDMGRGDCDGNTANGCEVDLDSDVRNCRMCGAACSLAHATPECVSGGCQVMTCEAGFANCDLMDGNGCEVDLNASVTHCGACGRSCAIPRGTPRCAMGACALAACDAGFGNCDGSLTNGCETDTNTSPTHCGACGTVCTAPPHARATCAAARCGFACDAGWSDCDGNAANGCEVNTAADPSNCGACRNACAFANAGATCSAGVCAIGSCNAGYGNCDGFAGNGCEVNTRTDTNHCGGCGVACVVPNGTGACVASTCTVTGCTGAYNDCDRVASNGCEADLASSATNCGACGTVCGSGATCTLGRCATPFAGYAVTTPTSDVVWVEACSQPGALAGLRSADDEYVFATLEFPVSFWGARDTGLFIQSNGVVSFGPVINRAGAIPTTAPIGHFGSLPASMGVSPAVYAFGVDLVLSSQGVCIATLGTAPNRRVIVQTAGAQLYNLAGALVSFEVIAYEANANIDVLYSPSSFVTPAGFTFQSPGNVTVGVQDFRSPLRGVNYTGTISAGTRIRFSPL